MPCPGEAESKTTARLASNYVVLPGFQPGGRRDDMLAEGLSFRQRQHLDGPAPDRHNRFVRFVILLSAALSLLPMPLAGQTPTHTVTYTNGLVTVHAKNAPLAEVFATLSQQGIVEVIGSNRLTGQVTIDIEAQRVVAAVPALLADYNFVVTTPPPPNGKTFGVVRVRVHSRRDGTAPSASLTGPIAIAELDALRIAEEAAEEPDPDEEPDPEEEAERREEEADRVAELTEHERLGAFAATVPIANLAELLDEENALVRTRALTELNGRNSPQAIAFLLKGLDDEETTVRYHVVDLLGRRSDAASLKQLGEALVRGEESAVRYGAFMALAMRADPASVSSVEAVANDRDPTIRTAAATFLREMTRRRR